MPWAWVLGGSAWQRAAWIREWRHPNTQNLAVFWLWWVTRRGRLFLCTVFQQLGSCRRGEAGIGRNGLPQEGMVSKGLADLGRPVGSVFYRNRLCLVVGSPLELGCVSGSIITGLAISLCVKETSQVVDELFDGRKS